MTVCLVMNSISSMTTIFDLRRGGGEESLKTGMHIICLQRNAAGHIQ